MSTEKIFDFLFHSRGRRFSFCFLFLAVWMLLIFCFSAQPTWTTSRAWMLFTPLRKAAHMIEFAALACIVWLALRSCQARWPRLECYLYPLAFLLPLLYAILDETHQYFVPNRQARITDVITDAWGILLALGLIWIWEHRRALIPGRLIPLPVHFRDDR